MSTLYIIGAGGLGREIAKTAEVMKVWHEIRFIDDNLIGKSINGIEVIAGVDYIKDLLVVSDVFIAIADINIRKNIYERISVNPFLSYPNVIHPSALFLSRDLVKMGRGNFFALGATISINNSFGNFNLVNQNVSLSHDTEVLDFCTIMHGVTVSSGVLVKNAVFLSAGATIAQFCVICDGEILKPNCVHVQNNSRL